MISVPIIEEDELYSPKKPPSLVSYSSHWLASMKLWTTSLQVQIRGIRQSTVSVSVPLAILNVNPLATSFSIHADFITKSIEFCLSLQFVNAWSYAVFECRKKCTWEMHVKLVFSSSLARLSTFSLHSCRNMNAVINLWI